jgi:hypothetical protein
MVDAWVGSMSLGLTPIRSCGREAQESLADAAAAATRIRPRNVGIGNPPPEDAELEGEALEVADAEPDGRGLAVPDAVAEARGELVALALVVGLAVELALVVGHAVLLGLAEPLAELLAEALAVDELLELADGLPLEPPVIV